MLILRVYAEMKEWDAAEVGISYRRAILQPPGWTVFSVTPYLDEPLMAWHRSPANNSYYLNERHYISSFYYDCLNRQMNSIAVVCASYFSNACAYITKFVLLCLLCMECQYLLCFSQQDIGGLSQSEVLSVGKLIVVVPVRLAAIVSSLRP